MGLHKFLEPELGEVERDQEPDRRNLCDGFGAGLRVPEEFPRRSTLAEGGQVVDRPRRTRRCAASQRGHDGISANRSPGPYLRVTPPANGKHPRGRRPLGAIVDESDADWPMRFVP